jgi:hypothetical protein
MPVASLESVQIGPKIEAISTPIFWIFNEDILPAGYRLEQKRSQSGDDCHYNIHGVPDTALRKLLNSNKLEDYRICDNGGH